MKRSELIAVLMGAATWPFLATAQERLAPLLGYLSNGSEEESRDSIKTFEQGLAAVGYTRGQNLTIDYRF